MSQNNALVGLFNPNVMRSLYKNLPKGCEKEITKDGSAAGKKDKAVDMRPSLICKFLALQGILLELTVPTLFTFSNYINNSTLGLALKWIELFVFNNYNEAEALSLSGDPDLHIDFQYDAILLGTVLHIWILLQLPIASVFHWNISTITIVWTCWGRKYIDSWLGIGKALGIGRVVGDASSGRITGSDLGIWNRLVLGGDFSLPSLLLSLFLITTLIIIPIYGNLYPKKVPFLLAFRPYAGNWRWCFLVYDKKKVSKKLRQIKSYDEVEWDQLLELDSSSKTKSSKTDKSNDIEKKSWFNRIPSIPVLFGWPSMVPNFSYQINDVLTATILSFPNYRSLVSICEYLGREKFSTNSSKSTSKSSHHQLIEKDSNIGILIHEILGTRTLGFCFGYGWPICRPSYRDALREICDIKKENECFLIQYEPLGLFEGVFDKGSREVEVRIVDIGKKVDTYEEAIVWEKRLSWNRLCAVNFT